VGKSSLLNWVLQRQLARVAKAPGKTRTLNFFLVNRRLYLVDLPGYGYAKVSRDLRDQWGRDVAGYLRTEERLAGVVTLIDIRHGPTDLDLDLQQLVLEAGRERVVVLTKADKVARGQAARMRDLVRRQLDLALPPAVVSVKTGEGRQELLAAISELAREWSERQRGE
jgi:GTP-binding protein